MLTAQDVIHKYLQQGCNMIEIEGLEGLEDIIKDMVDTDKMVAAMGKACALVEKEAKFNAPKETSFITLAEKSWSFGS